MIRICFTGLIIWSACLTVVTATESNNKKEFSEPLTQDSVVIESKAFQLKVDTKNGLNPCFLYDKKNQFLLANGDYYYGFGRPQKVEVERKVLSNNRQQITFTGFTDDLLVTHTFFRN